MPDEACAMARHAFEDALADLDFASEEVYKEASMILQLLRDNITFWTEDETET